MSKKSASFSSGTYQRNFLPRFEQEAGSISFLGQRDDGLIVEDNELSHLSLRAQYTGSDHT